MHYFSPIVCRGIITTTFGVNPLSPNSKQVQCITDASISQALDIIRDCNNIDLSDVRFFVSFCAKIKAPTYVLCSYQMSVTMGFALTAFQAFISVVDSTG